MPTIKIHWIGLKDHRGFGQIHLSIEAQCGTACLPMGDCHRNTDSVKVEVAFRSHKAEETLKMNVQNTSYNGSIQLLPLDIESSADLEEKKWFEKPYIFFSMIMYVFIIPPLSFCGVCGNLMSLHIIGKDKVVRRATGFLLRVLALTDIVFLLLSILVFTLGTIERYTDWSPFLQWYYPYIWSYAWPLEGMAKTCGVWVIVLVSADRYIAVCKALHASRYLTMSRMRMAVILILVFSTLFNLPRFWQSTTQYKPDTGNQTIMKPYIKITDFGQSDIYFIISTCCFFIFSFLIPLICLAFFNVRVLLAVSQSYKNMGELQGHPRNQNGNKLTKETVRYTIQLLVVVLVFFLCTTPHYVFRIWY